MASNHRFYLRSVLPITPLAGYNSPLTLSLQSTISSRIRFVVGLFWNIYRRKLFYYLPCVWLLQNNVHSHARNSIDHINVVFHLMIQHLLFVLHNMHSYKHPYEYTQLYTQIRYSHLRNNRFSVILDLHVCTLCKAYVSN